jgi:hypothetical protein
MLQISSENLTPGFDPNTQTLQSTPLPWGKTLVILLVQNGLVTFPVTRPAFDHSVNQLYTAPSQ